MSFARIAALVLGIACYARAASMVDPTFKVGTGGNWYVEQMLEQPDGKILICGLISEYDGKPLPYIGRLNADGSIDESFKAQPSYWVRHMILLRNGKIIIGGMFTYVGTTPRKLIARLNPDGSLDETFNPGRGGEGSIGTSIYGDPREFIIWMDVQPDGKILATGNFHDYDGASSSGIVRINPDGSRDASFNVGGGINTWGRFVKRFDNGQIALSGWFTSYNNRSFNRLVILNSDGSFDAGVNAFYGDKTSVYVVHRQEDGRWITGGHSLNDQGLFKREIVRINTDGSVDESWPTKANEGVQNILPQSNGQILIAGQFTTVNDVWRPGLARLNADGSLDQSLYAGVAGMIWGISQTRDKKLLVCGQFTSIDGIPLKYLARLILPEDLEPPPPPPLKEPQIGNARISAGKFQCEVESAADALYTLEFKEELNTGAWTPLPETEGTGQLITLEDAEAGTGRFYRIQARRKP
ncbi:MAG TPA: delta-60 repeat domain-containing protein [Verrucomicrobiae bacterium]|nr:delta-60 repeat domain-containing protein [Verrucomicrobiae bacterium]